MRFQCLPSPKSNVHNSVLAIVELQRLKLNIFGRPKSSLIRQVGLKRIPSHLSGLTTTSQWKRDWIRTDCKEVKCPSLAVDHRATEEKGARCSVTLGAVARLSLLRARWRARATRRGLRIPLFLEAEQDTSALLQICRTCGRGQSQLADMLLGKNHTDLVESGS